MPEYTNEDYEVLADILSQHYRDSYHIREAKRWVVGDLGDRGSSIIALKKRVAEMPYEDVPLHINTQSESVSIICTWRYRIGK